MSQAQYNAIGRTRLMDVKSIRESQLLAYIQSRPEWVQRALIQFLVKLS